MRFFFFFLVLFMQAIIEGHPLATNVKEEGFVGKFFCPVSEKPVPAILVLGGSEGGMNERPAELFTENGFASLALAYFKAEGLPQNLEKIPLEYFCKALQWLKERPEVDSSKIHIYGPSKGGELVLLLCSHFSDLFASAIAIVPSCVVYGGIPNHLVSSWTLQGEPLPFASTPGKEDVMRQLKTRRTIDLTSLFLDKMQYGEVFEQALIPVEKIKCSLLIISGQEDRVWPSSLYAELVMERLEAFHSPIHREHLSYEGAGHMICAPTVPIMTKPFKHPVTGLYYEVGGEPEAQERACKESWEAILRFLN